MATHSNILAWEIPWTEEPSGLQSMGSQSQTRPSTQKHYFNHVIKLSSLEMVGGRWGWGGRNFPRGSVVKTPSFQFRGMGSVPSRFHMWQSETKKIKKRNKERKERKMG